MFFPKMRRKKLKKKIHKSNCTKLKMDVIGRRNRGHFFFKGQFPKLCKNFWKKINFQFCPQKSFFYNFFFLQKSFWMFYPKMGEKNLKKTIFHESNCTKLKMDVIGRRNEDHFFFKGQFPKILKNFCKKINFQFCP